MNRVREAMSMRMRQVLSLVFERQCRPVRLFLADGVLVQYLVRPGVGHTRFCAVPVFVHAVPETPATRTFTESVHFVVSRLLNFRPSRTPSYRSKAEHESGERCCNFITNSARGPRKNTNERKCAVLYSLDMLHKFRARISNLPSG